MIIASHLLTPFKCKINAVMKMEIIVTVVGAVEIDVLTPGTEHEMQTQDWKGYLGSW